jgi:phage gp46-like protein
MDGNRMVVTVKSSQKIFTEQEISGMTGVCLEHLRGLARAKHLGSIVRAAESAGEQAEQWLYTVSDLMVVAILSQRCHH